MPPSRPRPSFIAPQDAASLLADKLPARLLIPYLLSALALAIAYGASFLLADALHAAGFEAAEAGTVISIGTLATLIGSTFAGRIAQRTGILPVIAAAGLIMALAMTCFALAASAGIAVAYAGGVLLGLGWPRRSVISWRPGSAASRLPSPPTQRSAWPRPRWPGGCAVRWRASRSCR